MGTRSVWAPRISGSLATGCAPTLAAKMLQDKSVTKPFLLCGFFSPPLVQRYRSEKLRVHRKVFVGVGERQMELPDNKVNKSKNYSTTLIH